MTGQSETKQRILDTTLRLIKEKPNVTIKDITDASFVNVAAVNYHFGDKDKLINIVVENIIKGFKKEVFENISSIPQNQKPEVTLAFMLDLLYEFAVENIGVLSYIFVNFSASRSTSNILIREFLEDNEFTALVLAIMKFQTGVVDENILYARYMLLFSSFCIPLFIEIMNTFNKDTPLKLSWRNNKELKKHYIDELIKIIG